jgi:hypothetical protein
VKKIRAKYPPSDPLLRINNLTLFPGEEIPIFDEKILESPQMKKALQEGKIEIIDEGPAQPVTDASSQA